MHLKNLSYFTCKSSFFVNALATARFYDIFVDFGVYHVLTVSCNIILSISHFFMVLQSLRAFLKISNYYAFLCLPNEASRPSRKTIASKIGPTAASEFTFVLSLASTRHDRREQLSAVCPHRRSLARYARRSSRRFITCS